MRNSPLPSSLALVAFLLLLTIALPGCSANAGRSTVTGTVTLDGQPIKAGLIRFLPADGASATADAPITDGKFTATVPPGDKRIEITAPKVLGKKKLYDTPDSPTVDIVEELLPAHYNVASTLTMNVTAGKQSKDFALTTDL